MLAPNHDLCTEICLEDLFVKLTDFEQTIIDWLLFVVLKLTLLLIQNVSVIVWSRILTMLYVSIPYMIIKSFG